MNRTAEHLSALQLDALGSAATPQARARAEAHLEGCAHCRARLEELTALKAHFTAHVLPATAPALRARLRAPSRPRWALRLVPPVLLAAAAALGLLVLLPPAAPQGPAGADLGIKGGPLLAVYAHRAQMVWRLAPGEALAPGDQIRFAVEPAGLPYLLVASVDGAGQVSVYFPFEGAWSAPVPANGELPGSVVLDAAPGPERLFAFFSREPIAAQDVTSALAPLAAAGHEALRATTHLEGVHAEAQASVLFEKASR